MDSCKSVAAVTLLGKRITTNNSIVFVLKWIVDVNLKKIDC